MFRGARSLKSLALSDEFLASIRTPTFFLWGENDPFGGADVAHRLVAAMPDARLELMPAAGHAPWLDDVDHVATTISEFLVS